MPRESLWSDKRNKVEPHLKSEHRKYRPISLSLSLFLCLSLSVARTFSGGRAAPLHGSYLHCSRRSCRRRFDLPNDGRVCERTFEVCRRHTCNALRKRVPPRTPVLPLVLLRESTSELRGSFLDDTDVDVAARPQIVEYTRRNRLVHELLCLLLGHRVLVFRLENCHCSQRARAHGHEREAVRRPVWVHRVQVRPVQVASAQHQSGADVPLILEQHLLEHRESSHNSALTTCAEPMQLQLRRDQLRCVFGICGGSRSAAIDVRRNVVDLLAPFLEDDVVGCRPGVCTENHAIFEYHADDGRPRLDGFRGGVPTRFEHRIAHAVVKRKSSFRLHLAQRQTRTRSLS
mmetsp:Transcript_9760/g.26021  ORF Transcript_9760/g.26021 Transcript_9760/m.26021 type:complete len:345 (+) Transcript_9760:417-1451(+)